MARYYDIDKLKEMIEAKADTLIEGKGAFLCVAKWLELLPPADVVEVVRCKDCVKRQTPDCTMWYQCSVCGGQWSWENDAAFCSLGERKGT